MRYPIEPEDRIYLKGYQFFTFAKNMVKIYGIRIAKNLMIVQKYLQMIQ